MSDKPYTKLALIRELATNTGMTQKKTRVVLELLRQIAYRETAKAGFTIPGVCKLDIIRRKPRKTRNPQSGETLLIAEHDALRVRPLKAARNAITPPPENLVTVLPPAAAAFDDFSQAISFKCKSCNLEIEAPHAAIGMVVPCPACATDLTIPPLSEPGTLHGAPLPSAPAQAVAPSVPPPPPPVIPADVTQPVTALVDAPPASSAPPPNQGGRTIRIDLAALGFAPEPAPSRPTKRMLSFFCPSCRQEIEAPADMAGSPAECSTCGTSFEIPFFSTPGTLHGSDLDTDNMDPTALKDMRARTIRIELPDDI